MIPMIYTENRRFSEQMRGAGLFNLKNKFEAVTKKPR
jgi:hypothetical protein